jgi:hypothetical protein
MAERRRWGTKTLDRMGIREFRRTRKGWVWGMFHDGYGVKVTEGGKVHFDQGEGALCGADKNVVDVMTTSDAVDCKRCIKIYGVPVKNVGATFSEADPATWHDTQLPAGYDWREIGDGEFHLFAPDGRDVSQERYETVATVSVESAVKAVSDWRNGVAPEITPEVQAVIDEKIAAEHVRWDSDGDKWVGHPDGSWHMDKPGYAPLAQSTLDGVESNYGPLTTAEGHPVTGEITAADVYPINVNGAVRWACCLSTIGRPCAHEQAQPRFPRPFGKGKRKATRSNRRRVRGGK